MNTRVDTTPESRSAVCKLLCDELEKGLSIQRACDIVGVSYFMYANWKKRAAKGDDEAIVLLRSLKKARARGLEKHIGVINAAAEEGDWRAAAWLATKQYADMRDEPVEEIEAPAPQEPQIDQFGNEVDLSGYDSEKRRTMLDAITAEIAGRSKQPQQYEPPPQPPKHTLIEAALFTALAGWLARPA